MSDAARSESVSGTILFGVIFLLGACLFLYNFSFFKFATDEPYGMILGEIALDKNLLISHGRGSDATGLVFGPNFVYLMGAIAWFTHDPRYVMLAITLLNVAGVLLGVIYLARTLPVAYAAGATLLLAINPGLVLNANRIWEPAPIFFFVVLFHIALYHFLKRGAPSSFVAACAFATIVSQFHLSGFFLFPLLGILAISYRKLLGLRWLAVCLATTLLLAAPFIYFLFVEEGLKQIAGYFAASGGAGGAEHDFFSADYWRLRVINPAQRTLDMNFGASSIYFFKYVFGNRLFRHVVERYSGSLATPLYWLSMTVGFSFLAGWIAYIAWAIRNRNFFSIESETNASYPLPFQISGFLVSGVAATYLILRLTSWPHYFQVLYPCYAILSAWLMWRLWRYIPVRIFTCLCLASHVALVFILMSGIKTSGAAASYRITYETQEKIRDAVWKATPNGKVPQIYLHSRIFNLAAVYSMVGWEAAIGDATVEPVAVATGWDGYNLKALWSVKNIGLEISERIGLLEEAVKIIPDGASALADDSFNSELKPAATEVGRFMPLSDIPLSDQKIKTAWLKSTALADGYPNQFTPYQLLKNRANATRYQGGPLPANADGVEYVVLNLSDPRKLNPARNRWGRKTLQEMLLNANYGLLYQENGVFIFKKGLIKKLDAHFFRDYIFSYHARTLPQQTGVNAVVSLMPSRELHIVSDEIGEPGFLSFGPYITLPKGDYKALFDIRIKSDNGQPALHLDVSGMGGNQVLAQKEVTDASDGQWQTVSLPFSINRERMEKIEFRVFFKGGGAVFFEKVRLEMSDRQIEAYINDLKK